MYILIPGRHHLLTKFQFDYVHSILQNGLNKVRDLDGQPIQTEENIEGLIFAITSSNHSGTKRNPFPFYLRAMMVQGFMEALGCNGFIYGIDDVGSIDNFASYTLKNIAHQSDTRFNITPDNSLVLCSTPVLKSYQELGFTILPCELNTTEPPMYKHPLPWKWVEQIAQSADSLNSEEIQQNVHQSTLKIWANYDLAKKVSEIMKDPILGDDGDITTSRDYNIYVRQMDEIADLKYEETASYILPGNVGDIGCAVGSWIKLACADTRLSESDFYGIEVARQLFEICQQRKSNREFSNPNVFFAQKNAVTNLVFQKGAMHTVHTSSLTHEIVSYGSISDLQNFILNRYHELASGGVWINRDVIGPENGQQEVLMLLNSQDGENKDFEQQFTSQTALAEYLKTLSTFTLFKRFALDFRKEENDQIDYKLISIEGEQYIQLTLTNACEFMLTKDYTDNWESEMHERFCFWSYNDWKSAMKQAGFQMVPGSGAYTNPWIKENRFDNKVWLFRRDKGKLIELSHPPTNALIVGKKRGN